MSTHISTVNALSTNSKWKPRKTETLTCPSGQEVQVRRPGPEFMLRASRTAHTFSKTKPETKEGLTPEEFGLNTFAAMGDEELAAVMIFARELVIAMLVSPKLVMEPRAGFNEIGPDDIGDDFWFLFNYAMTGFFGLKVPVGSEEVEVSDLETFRREQSVSGDSTDGAEVRTDTEWPAGDPGLVGSA